jgi:hypothetical protein
MAPCPKIVRTGIGIRHDNCDLVRAKSEHLACNLRQSRVGSASEIVERTDKLDPSVGQQLQRRSGLFVEAWIAAIDMGGGSHSHTPSPAAASLTRLKALRPFECVGATHETLAPARVAEIESLPRLLASRTDNISQAQLDRIEL